jgi:4-aminobutyrate aminotransferase-like enzyme/Ser/Thr protein kinase RdoA (MazF antagonist)
MSVTKEDVVKVVKSVYDLTGRVSNLGSCQDINFKFTDAATSHSFVVKFTDRAVCSEQEILFQHAAIIYLQSCQSCAAISLPIPLSSTSGAMVSGVVVNEKEYYVRMLKFVDGNILSEYKYFSPEVLASFGAFVGSITLSMAGFETFLAEQAHLLSVADREIEWDLRRASRVIDGFMSSFCASTNPEEVAHQETFQRQYKRSNSLLNYVQQQAAKTEQGLRTQILHGDLAHYNVVAQTDVSGRPVVSGVIDFGDAMRSWTVAELAVAVVSGFAGDSTNSTALEEACSVLKGFISAHPLNEWEVTALWPLVILRSMVNILCIRSELEKDASNAYNQEGIVVEWRIFDRIAQVPIDVAVEALRSTAGFPPLHAVPAPLHSRPALFETSCVAVQAIDLSVESPLFYEGNWRSDNATTGDVDPLRKLVDSLELTHRDGQNVAAVVCPYGVPLMHRSNTNSMIEPNAVALGVRVLFRPVGSSDAPVLLHVPEGYKLLAESTVDNKLTLNFEGASKELLSFTLPADSLMPAENGAPTDGHQLRMVNHSEVFVQLTLPTIDASVLERFPVPDYCSAHMFPVWKRISPSPHAYFDLPLAEALQQETSAPCTEDELASRAVQQRAQHVAAVQEHYFRRPPRIERGFGQHLYSPSGRGYLDMVNNVAVVGHCHPAVYAAATAQMRLLNTNSRFVYKQLSAFADKIVATMPPNAPNLNAVFFVNSGSEATDLAMRIARTVATYHHKQRLGVEQLALCRDTICLEGAYHGVTTASDEVSTTLNDNPHALSSRPDWIHLAPMPNPFRGKFTYESASDGAGAADKYATFVTNIISTLQERGRVPACFIAEPLSGNAGGVELPAGYLKRVYAEVRAAGGLCIADEVQVGYGRLGTHFWGHQEHDVVPDVLTMAKAAGNGHPLGFVVTSKENAAVFGAESGSFFSSAGGGPVSCAIGCAVLDTIAAEGLQENAREVGAYLNVKLRGLAERNRHIVGCIHGHGLYQGIELVRGGPCSILAPSHFTEGQDSKNFPAGKVPATAEAYAICERLLNLGVVCHNTGDYSNVLKVKPPLCFSKQDADFFVQALEIALQGW